MDNQCLICLGIFLWSNNHLITINVSYSCVQLDSLFGKQEVGKLLM